MSSSQSLLLKLPPENLQTILSFVTLSELLALGQTSVLNLQMINLAHYLCYLPEEDSSSNSNSRPDLRSSMITLSNSRRSSASDLRRSLPNIHNLDAFSSHNFGRSMIHHRSDLSMTKIAHMLNKFHYLRALVLYKMDHVGDRFLGILNAAPCRRYLTHIEFHDLNIGSIHINQQNHTTAQLVLPTDRLQYVELDGVLFCNYQSVIQPFVLSKVLKILKLIGCRLLKDVHVKDMMEKQLPPYNSNSQLHTLCLEECSRLSAPFIVSETIHTLSLAKCQLIQDLHHIKCKSLIHADLSRCSMLSNESIHGFVKFHEKTLETLNLNNCGSISRIDFVQEHVLRKEKLESLGSRQGDQEEVRMNLIFSVPRKLTELDLSLCTGLEFVRIVAPSLKFLNLGMCLKMKHLHLHLPEIESLDLSILNLELLSIEAPNLVFLNLSGCSKLKSIDKFICPNIETLDICGTDLSGKDFNLGKKFRGLKCGGDVSDLEKITSNLENFPA